MYILVSEHFVVPKLCQSGLRFVSESPGSSGNTMNTMHVAKKSRQLVNGSPYLRYNVDLKVLLV